MASVLDPPLVSVSAANIPVASTPSKTTIKEVLPPAAALPLIAVAFCAAGRWSVVFHVSKISQRGRHLHELLLFFDCTALRAPEMFVFQITSFIIICSVFLHTHSDKNIYSVVVPQTVTALTGSCVEIPCAFSVFDFEEKRKRANFIYGIWLKNKQFGSFIAFNSSKNNIRGFSYIQMTGNLSERDCTTVFYNIMKNHSDLYYFRLEMEPNVFRATFPNPADSSDSSKTVKITVIDSPKPPIFTPTDLKRVMEGTTVNLSCSAGAPCPEKPPTISWSNIPQSAHNTTQLQENPDKTLSVFSYVTFKALYMDHRKNISCTATYTRNTPDVSIVESTVMLQVQFSPKETHITIKPSHSISVGTNVTLTCKSKASPSNELIYTWYKHGQEMLLARGKKLTFILNNKNTGLYFCIAQNKHGNQSSPEIQLTAEGQDGPSTPMIASCVGGTVAVLTLSAIGFCKKTRKKTHRGDNVGENDSLNQAQDDRNSTYANVLTMTNQDNQISDDQSVRDCNTEFSTPIDHNEKGSDVVYAQVHLVNKKPKPISVLPEDIYSQVKKDHHCLQLCFPWKF
ncbi:myelin-associated glycoprotein-like [Labeo rohita]|uniref:myelin-associated glycoprotein-like n=1 Tax=Labeo rohita TaxID=84645 RepID=UPI0021E20137|nr:myelin-associated glycoprotein-like [Labeo rohita]